jgi:protein-S-isoprenylcysteine O-methyltransferase Ste14
MALPPAMTKTIAEMIWFAGMIGWSVIRHPFARRSRKTAVRRSLLDRKEGALLAITLLGMFFIPAAYALTGIPARFDRPFEPAWAWVGIAVLGAALWLFRRSHADLGRNFSATLKIREAHQLVTTGVYRFVRHPMYASFFLLALAQFLLLPNWLVDIAGLSGAGILFAFRIEREEQMMIEQFGDVYRSYMTRTKRVIPWLL